MQTMISSMKPHPLETEVKYIAYSSIATARETKERLWTYNKSSQTTKSTVIVSEKPSESAVK